MRRLSRFPVGHQSTIPRTPVHWHRLDNGRPLLATRRSEEKVQLVGLALRSAVPSEAHFLKVVGAKFVTKEETVRGRPGLQLPVHDRQRLTAECTTRRRIGIAGVR